MRHRTSAALALVMALLASPVAALACGFDCWPAPTPVATVQTVEGPSDEGSCHRDVEEPVDGSFTFNAAPHDCSDHSGLETGLTTPRSLNGASASVGSITALPSVVYHTLSAAPSRVNQVAAHDLAPPGRTPALIAPLRI